MTAHCEGSASLAHALPSWYVDRLDCGHEQMVEVLVPVPPEFRKLHVIGTSTFCGQCPPRKTAVKSTGMALAVVLDCRELRRGVCVTCGQPVPCNADGFAIEHDRVDIEAMLDAGAFDD